MTVAEVKRKLRQLKQEELRIRSEGVKFDQTKLVFKGFFVMKESTTTKGLYSFNQLSQMTHDQRKEVFEIFFLNVYVTWLRDNHLPMNRLYDPIILGKMGLDYSANERDIKAKFKELAKRHHPDAGGESNRFIELKMLYDELLSSD